MARKSKMKSPEKADSDFDSDEEVVVAVEVNEGDSTLLASSPLKRDGETVQLGNHVPILFPSPQLLEAEAADEELLDTPTANMGNAQSRDENIANVRALADELQTRHEGRTTRLSTGRLPRVSNGATNPPFRNPVVGIHAQRKLGAKNKGLESVYDLGESPDKPPPVKTSRAFEQAPQFSPNRVERKKAKQRREQPQAPLATEQGQEVDHQGLAEEAEPDESPTAGYQVSPAAAREIAGGDLNTQDERYRDFYPAGVVQRYQEEHAAAGAEVDVNKDGEDSDVEVEVEAAENEEGAEEEQVASAPRAVGRPKKRSSTRKPGRPRKSSEPTNLRRSPRHQKGSSKASNTYNLRTPTKDNRPAQQTPSKKSASQSVQKSKSARQKKRNENAVKDSNRRRSGEAVPDVEGQDNGEYQAHSEDDTGGAEDGADENLQEQPKDAPRPGTGSSKNRSRPPAGVPKVKKGRQGTQEEANRGKKRKLESGNEKAVEQPEDKRRRKENEAENLADGEQLARADADVESNLRRFFGQWLPLKNAFKKLDVVGCNIMAGVRLPPNRIPLKDKQVEAVVVLCREARKRFLELKDHTGNLDADHGPAELLDEIGRRIDGLRGLNDEYPTDFTNVRKSKGCYFHVIPGLVKLARIALLCYETMDKDDVPEGQIKITHLRIVYEFLELALRLNDTLGKKYPKPETNLHLVQPMREAVVHLRDIRLAFALEIQKHEHSVEQARTKQEEATQRALRLEQEERRGQQEAYIRRLREKWEKLHEERRWAEGGLVRRPKLEHLQIPDHSIEADQDGQPFERTEVFLPRVGPSPGLVDEAAAKEWSMVELNALCDGLKQYTGPNVFERIFRKYCSQGRELNRYNVTEIVTMAAKIREALIEDQRGKYGDVEAWISAVPVWTKGHQALGKENEDGDGVVNAGGDADGDTHGDANVGEDGDENGEVVHPATES